MQWRYCPTTHFSERIPVITRRMAVYQASFFFFIIHLEDDGCQNWMASTCDTPKPWELELHSYLTAVLVALWTGHKQVSSESSVVHFVHTVSPVCWAW